MPKGFPLQFFDLTGQKLQVSSAVVIDPLIYKSKTITKPVFDMPTGEITVYPVLNINKFTVLLHGHIHFGFLNNKIWFQTNDEGYSKILYSDHLLKIKHDKWKIKAKYSHSEQMPENTRMVYLNIIKK